MPIQIAAALWSWFIVFHILHHVQSDLMQLLAILQKSLDWVIFLDMLTVWLGSARSYFTIVHIQIFLQNGDKYHSTQILFQNNWKFYLLVPAMPNTANFC